jgi:hypothetical protein
MTNKEREKIEKIVSELDTAVGKLLVPSMIDKLVTDAMQQVSKASFDLTNML